MPTYEVDLYVTTLFTMTVEANNSAQAKSYAEDQWMLNGPHLPDHADRAYTTEARRVTRLPSNPKPERVIVTIASMRNAQQFPCAGLDDVLSVLAGWESNDKADPRGIGMHFHSRVQRALQSVRLSLVWDNPIQSITLDGKDEFVDCYVRVSLHYA